MRSLRFENGLKMVLKMTKNERLAFDDSEVTMQVAMPEIRKSTSKPKKAKNNHSGCDSKMKHPSHTLVLPRLNRIEGQIRGISEMVSSERYCVDILIQVRAALAALRGVEMEIFQKHMKSCVHEAMTSKDTAAAEKKIEELVQLLIKRTTI